MARYVYPYYEKIKKKAKPNKKLYREVFKIKKVNKNKFELEIWTYEFNNEIAVCMEYYAFDSLAKLHLFKKETCESSPFPLNPHIYN